jgi:hypothetical protein
MRSDVSLAVCGDLPQGRDGSERQTARKCSYLRRSAGLATRGEKCRHLSRVWRELSDQWRIVERRLVRSGDSVSPQVAWGKRIRHTWRVGVRIFAIYRARSGRELASRHDVHHLSCKIARRGTEVSTACRTYRTMRCWGLGRPAEDRAAHHRRHAGWQRAPLSRSEAHRTDEWPVRAGAAGYVEVWAMPASADYYRPLI